MENNQKKSDFLKHLHNYLVIGILIFIGILVSSAIFIVFDSGNTIFNFEIPIMIYYLGIFISSMMLLMGVYYLRHIDKQLKK